MSADAIGAETKRLRYVVMRIVPWTRIREEPLGRFVAESPVAGCIGFLCVFETRAAAAAFVVASGYDDSDIEEVRTLSLSHDAV